ncbi:MAG: hypothetical protein NTV10_08980 [Methanoregula sp.]|nr:hypothetical protein [Methanoregula sp.]
MPLTGGVGIDPLVMLLTNNNLIQEVILFPQIKSVQERGQRMKSEGRLE